MITHETVAREIASNPESLPVLAHTSARQGDLVLRRDSHDAPSGLPLAAIQLAAGAHGEHWAVGPCALKGDVLTAAHGTVVVHTDVPDARHRAIVLEPGTWRIGRQRELSIDHVIQNVRD